MIVNDTPILDLETPWEGRTHGAVEDFIKRSFIGHGKEISALLRQMEEVISDHVTDFDALSARISNVKSDLDSLAAWAGDGTVKSVGLSMPTGFSVGGSPVTDSGVLSVSFAAGYSLPTTAKQSAWDAKQDAISDLATIRSNASTAYGWGNHAAAGYATSAAFTTLANRVSTLESDAVLTLSHTGDGNVVTSVSKSGNQVMVINGITALTAVTASTSGSGNVVTAVTASGGSVTVTKGITALTADDISGVSYGSCTTAAETPAKGVTVGGNWKLRAGATIVVTFSNTNTASNPTLNVNGTGAKPIFYNTAVLTTSNLGYGGTATRPMMFVYDGTYYVFIGWSYDTNTTYSALTDANLKAGTETTARLVTAKLLADNYNIKDGVITIAGSTIKPLTTHQSIYSATFAAGAFSAKTYTPNSAAQTINIPTQTSHLTNDSGFITSHQSLANYVTLNTAQTISGQKTFTAYPIINLTATDLANKTQSAVLRASYKSNGLTFTTNIIAVIGSMQTAANNFDVRIGSATGATWISAGENGSHLHEYVAIENTETLWLSSDGSIKLYTACSNDGATFTNTANVSSTSVSPGTNNAFSLGTSSLRWSNTYTQLLNAAGAATLSSTLSVGGAATLSSTLSVTGATTLNSTLSVSGKITSTVATGTAPLQVASTTLVSNLNADMLDGKHASDFLGASATAVSATTLATSRTLWGQSFNGSANVSGNMTGVGSITASGSHTITGVNIGHGIKSDSYNMSLWMGSSGVNRGLYDHTNGVWWIYRDAKLTTIINGDNVIIGAASSTYKLHVAGTFYASGAATLASTLAVSGQATVGSLKIGDATLSWDATNKALKSDKALYSLEGITAGGIGSSSGSGTATVAGGIEWYNLKLEQYGAFNYSSSKVEYPTLRTFIENYDTKLTGSNYCFMLLRWRKGYYGYKWKVPYFDNGSKDNNIPVNARKWPVIGDWTTWMNGTSLSTITAMTKISSRSKFSFANTGTRHQRYGVAIYKNTGAAKRPWQRVSNIVYFELFLAKNEGSENNPHIYMSIKQNK